MRHTEIPVLQRADTSLHANQLRLRAPKYVRSVIDDASALPGIKSLGFLREEQIIPLGGGKEAATYLIVTDHVQYILKLGISGLEAEAEALQRWHKKGARVPRVINHGVVPISRRTTPSIKYIVENAVLDKFGRVAETCESYLRHSPEDARKIGRLMGEELAKMHTANARRSFGNFADSDANKADYKTWNNYLQGYLATHADYLKSLGISDTDYDTVSKFINKCEFTKRGVYLHGDFSIRNASIQPHRSRIALFDPNPLIGDPSWDAAVLFNNYEFRKLRLQYDDTDSDLANRDLQILIGFKQSYPELPADNLLTARLFQAILQAQYQKTKRDKLAVRAREDFIHDVIKKMGREKSQWQKSGKK